MSEKFIKFGATFFNVGYFPKAPGSVASLVGMFLYFALYSVPILYGMLLIVVTIFGFAVCDRIEEILKEKDPSCVVIDEVAGVMIAFFLLPMTPAIAVTTFFLFRALDMFKLYPVNKFESLPGGVGIMMDDIFAGIYTNIVMHIAIRWAGII